MRTRSKILLLTACAMFAACSDSAPTAPSAGVTGEVEASPLASVDKVGGSNTFDWQDVTTYCHEDIAFEGVFTVSWRRILTESGRWSYIANYSDEGTGVGLTSGAAYLLRMQGTFHQNLDLNDLDPWTQTEVNTIKILGDGSVPNILGKYRLKFTFTPDGELVVDRQSFEVSCLG